MCTISLISCSLSLTSVLTMNEITLMIDVLQFWSQQQIPRDQALEILVTTARSDRGRRLLEQVHTLLQDALEATA
jgi:hypothetical protein